MSPIQTILDYIKIHDMHTEDQSGVQEGKCMYAHSFTRERESPEIAQDGSHIRTLSMQHNS